MSDLPTVVTSAGLQPQSPASLNAQIISGAQIYSPGLTANLPGLLIEDVASTDTAALVLCDQARVETVNSLTPYGSNNFLTIQLGNIYGVLQGVGFNTSVFVIFSGPPGFPIAQGFTVSDGTYQYVAQEGSIIQSGGQSAAVFCLAVLTGIWAVLANTVTQLITSVPAGISLTVTNPNAGLQSTGPQPPQDYRAQVLQAGIAASQGMARYLKTLLGNVSGVQSRLVSVRQVNGGGWEIIVGGGDQYAVANAIWESLFDISTLVGSTMLVSSITRANPGVVATTLNHGYVTGQSVTIAGSNPSNYNGTFVATVIDEKTFSIGIDTTSYPAYVGSGVLTPNSRNVVVPINDYPDTYLIPFVTPPQQAVSIVLLWGTTSPNSVSVSAVNAAGSAGLVSYVNSIPVGAPMNLFELQNAFQTAVAGLIPTPLLTRMVFTVSINGIVTTPEAGTGIIAGDPESYFQTSSTAMSINQG